MAPHAGTVGRVLDAVNKRNADLAAMKKNDDLPVIPIQKSLTYDSNISLATYAYGGRALTNDEYNEVSKSCNDQCSFSALSRLGDQLNSMILSCYGNIEAGVEAICSTSPAALDNTKPSNIDVRIKSSKSKDSVKKQGVTLDDQESSVVTAQTEYRAEVPEQAQASRCLMSLLGCSGGHQQGKVDANLDDRYDEFSMDTDSLTFDETPYSPRSKYNMQPDLLTPKAQALLKEINDIKYSFIIDDVQKTASFEANKIDEIKAMTQIKKNLLEQQEFLTGAPEDSKRDFYRAVTRAATLNAEIAAQQAQLKLNQIRLESLRVQEEMNRLSVGNTTFDSSVDGYEFKHGLSCFPTVTTNKSDKNWKHRNGHATAE
jgi:hypothetical protein